MYFGWMASDGFLLLVLVQISIHHPRPTNASIRDSINRALEDRQQRIDSLAMLVKNEQQVMRQMVTTLDSMQTRDLLLNQQVKTLQARHNLLTQRYASLVKYDTMRAADIQRYLSDSIPLP